MWIDDRHADEIEDNIRPPMTRAITLTAGGHGFAPYQCVIYVTVSPLQTDDRPSDDDLRLVAHRIAEAVNAD
ncbi:MAG: hypothetical protein Q7R68_10780 [Nitrospirales bacterium]|nr:hypothetical protein [Nitrospirales bacterium]